MQIILSDHNCEGQARAIFDTIKYDEGLSWIPMKLMLFTDVGLHHKADDETVWRLSQEKGYLLLTGNRTASDGDISLELTIRRLVTPDILPVVTISNLRRVKPDPDYRKQCAERLAEIVLDLENYRGTTRLYLPR